MKWQPHTIVRLALPYVIGMGGAHLFAHSLHPSTLLAACCAALALMVATAASTTPQRRASATFGIAVTALALLTGTMLMALREEAMQRGVPTERSLCVGSLDEPPTEKHRTWGMQLTQSDGTKVLLYVPKAPLSCVGSLHEPSSPAPSLQRGDTVAAWLLHATPSPHLWGHGVCATAYSPHGRWTAHPATHRVHDLTTKAAQLRAQMGTAYERHGLTDQAARTVEALTLGMKKNMGKKEKEAYAKAGASHLMALSGLHVGMVAAMLQVVCLAWLLPRRWRWLATAAITIGLWAFAWMAGGSPSLIRATLMMTTLLLCRAARRTMPTGDACALALIVMLTIEPLQLLDVGFELSFVAVAAIVLWARKAMLTAHTWNPAWRLLWGAVSISAICSVATAPLVAHYFGRVSMWSVASTLALTPMVYGVMVGALAWWALAWWPAAQDVVGTMLNWTTSAMNTTVEHVASWPMAVIEWRPGWWHVAACYAAMLLLTVWAEGHRHDAHARSIATGWRSHDVPPHD